MIHILISAEQRIFRQGLHHLLDEYADLCVVAQTSGYAETLSAVRASEPDLAILELSMPGQYGIEIVGEIKAIRPNLKTLILSPRSVPSVAVRALHAGLDGIIAKESGIEELVAAVRHLANGGPQVCPDFQECVAHG